MKKTQDNFSCKKIETYVGKSTAIFDDIPIKTEELKWTFIIPKGAKVSSNLSENGGTVTFEMG